MKSLVSVIIIFRNEERYLKRCIESVLAQTYADFELILINDFSDDLSLNIAKFFNDKRIKLCINKKNLGLGKTREKGLQLAKGKYIFFTDADCIADKKWIQRGVSSFQKGVVGVEGKTNYLAKNPTVADTKVENIFGKRYMTCNIAYRKDTLKAIGGFGETFSSFMEDRDVAFKALAQGNISFNRNMLIYHQEKKWTPQTLMKRFIAQGRAKVLMVKIYNDYPQKFKYVAFYEHLLIMFIPPLLMFKGFRDKVRSWYDVKILATYYVACVVERFVIWKTAITEGVFII